MRYRFAKIFSLTTLSIYAFLRFALMIRQWGDISHNPLDLLKVVVTGEFFDLCAVGIMVLPAALYFSLLPKAWLESKAQQVLSFLVFNFILFLVLFGAVGEWLFWSEFGIRYNFIAVDYLIYTTEVVQNIRESYPIPLILGGLALFTLCFTVPNWKNLRINIRPESMRTRFLFPLLLLVFLAFQQKFVNNSSAEQFGNVYMNELAKNGTYSFVAAYKNNTLNFKKFYSLADDTKVSAHIRELLQSKESKFLKDGPYELTREIENNGGEEKHYNVIYLTIESLSGSFLKRFGNTENLTPHLDALINESVFFPNMYAAGTRTVRGLEALSLALPPTPGNSIIRRPENKNLFSVGQIFRDHNYDVKFIYGGYGYFDNMNDYFSKNEFDIVDRSSMPKEEVHFGNAWGVCDEDLFDRVLKEADASYANKKSFFSLVMSTSNHRPYTYPQKVAIKSGSTRQGAVQYTDYAIDRFLQQAKEKPWFKDTIFVIMADHCASVSGKTSLPIPEFHIPLYIYAPHIFKPQIVDKLMSQIDITPTVLGLLNFKYKSKFFGQDIFKNNPARIFMATYQQLGLYEKNRLAMLSPVKKEQIYEVDEKDLSSHLADKAWSAEDQQVLFDAITYYQSANYLYSNGGYQYDVRAPKAAN